MINAIIVDDDVEMLDGLASLICWKDYGFHIVGRAKNGFDALGLVTRYMPDVIITDITMPVMGGLELLREAKKFNQKIHGVIISCHEDFEYAREAIRLEADEYLIKHTLTEDVLTRTLMSLKEKICRSEKQRKELSFAIRGLNMNRYTIFRQFFCDIIKGGVIPDTQIELHAKMSAIPLPQTDYRAVCFFTDDENEPHRVTEQYGSFEYCVSNIIENTITETDGFVLFPFSGHSFVLLGWKDVFVDAPESRLLFLLKEAQSNVKSVLGVLLSVCVGGVYTSLQNLKDAVLEAEMLRNGYFYKGSGSVIYEPAVYPLNDLSSIYKEYAPRLKRAARNPERLREVSDELLRLGYTQHEPPAVKNMLNRLIFETASVIDCSLGIDIPRLEGATFDICRKAFNEAIGMIASNTARPPTTHVDILKALEYIDAHLCENISCEGVASYINMNNSYFSRLFKRETNINVSDYILNKRMQAATELLIHSNCSVEEIISKIGIESVSYFYRAYKRITGSTPGDVRSKAWQGL